MQYTYTVMEKKLTSPTDFHAMSPPNFEIIRLDNIVIEFPVNLGEQISGKEIITINHTKSGTILTVFKKGN